MFLCMYVCVCVGGGGGVSIHRLGCEAPKTMAAPAHTNQANQGNRQPRTTYGAAVVNVNKRSVYFILNAQSTVERTKRF